jgi:hypothetical protein
MNGVKKATEGVRVGKIRPEQGFTDLSDLPPIAEPLNVPELQLGETGIQLIVLIQFAVGADGGRGWSRAPG